MKRPSLGVIAASAALGAAGYLLARDSLLTWGATSAEAAQVARRRVAGRCRRRSLQGKWVISRNRFLMDGLVEKLLMEGMITGSLIMERKMLQGIKERAERLRDTQTVA